MTWTEFSRLIFEVYEHRINFAHEIDSAVNNSFMGMDEHLVCFFVQKYRLRDKIERRIIEFLASLKYYMDYWLRAKQYATLAGFLQIDETDT